MEYRLHILGSSSGSASLVTSGAVAIAQANDGAGSTRIPANCCGLVGLKPTRERLVNHDGTKFLPINMVYEGVLTRSVRDTAAFYAEAEKFYKNPKFPAIGNVTAPLKRRLKIAFFENPPIGETGHMHDDINRVQQETAKLLESLGHYVEMIPMPYNVEKMKQYYLNYYGFLAFMMIRFSPLMFGATIPPKEVEPFSYGLMKRFEKDIFKFPETLRVLKTKIKEKENELMSQYDVLMIPVTTLPTPKIGFFSPHLPPREIVEKTANFAPFPGMQNISGAPSICLPMGIDSNDMPVGVQFAATDGQERLLLELSYELEQAQPWRQMYDAS
ncbi:MAG: amidase family protein [Chitinophagales bacterium]|nr:amidase family protein [Chitinophagales bacterium]